MNKKIYIDGREISKEAPVFIIAEMSANHLMDYDRAIKIIDGAKAAGADAIKIQTYTPDTITIDCDKECFQTAKGGLWEGQNLYSLYQKAYTPWEWQPKLKEYCDQIGLICFSSPFDETAVDFMSDMDMGAYKVASFEINDIPLIRKIAQKKKPIIISTGIAYMADIDEALSTCKTQENEDVILLKCTSAYPSPYEDMNIKVIGTLEKSFDCIVGISDHSMGSEVVLGAVALGAKVVEKHVTLKRADGGEDSAFSMEMDEFADMVKQIRNLEKALGTTKYELTEKQIKSRDGSRSLFVVKDVKAGETFTKENVRSIRPGNGLHTRYYDDILGKSATRDLEKGTPLAFDCIRF